MSETVESSGKISLRLKTVPLVLHGPLITLGAVRRTEYPVRSEAVILVPLDSLLQDPLSGTSDWDHSSCVLVLTLCDEISCVHGSSDVNAVFIQVF